MEDFLLRLLEMSIAGSIAAAIVMLARLVLKRAPRAIVCALWIVVLFRLLCPFTIESAVGLFPAKELPVEPRQVIYATPYSMDEPDYRKPEFVIASPDSYIAPVIPVEENMELERRVDWVHIGWVTGFAMWIIGAAIMSLHGMVSLIRLRKRLQGAKRYDENVFIAKGLETAFVLGVLKPKIYLPDGLTEREFSYILMHEHTHVRRGDHIFKLIGYCALSIHWFNPVAWLAFSLAGRDLEMACDEAVIRRLGANVKKEYSASLLALATGKRIMSGMPLAFGEGDTKDRVKNVLKYKKPALWAAVIAVLIVVALCVGLACNQPQKTAMVRVEGAVYEWDGSIINKVPEGSRQIGMLKSVLQNRSKEPDLDMQGVNLDDQYVGCAMYTNDNGMLYLVTADGSALLFRLAVSSGNTAVQLNGSEFAALLNTDELIDVFHTLQMENGSIFIGYTIGEEGDIGAACVTREGKEYVLHSCGRINNLETYEGTALVSLGIPDKSWYEVLIVTDPAIAQAICRNSDGYTTIAMQDVPSVYVIEEEQIGTWEFYDKNGNLLEIKPSIMATETDSVAVEIIAPSEEEEDRVNALEFISKGEVMYLASALQDTVMGDYLDDLVLSSMLKSAAWPAENALPDDYFVMTRGDVNSGMQQHFVYMHPEFGKPVIQSGGYYTTFSDEDWEMLQRIVAADEDPYIYTVAQCYGTTEINRMVLGSKELRKSAEEIWNWRYLSSNSVSRAVISDIGECIKLTQTKLDGTETSAYLFQRGNTTIMQSGDQAAAVAVPEDNYTFLSELFHQTPVLASDVDGDREEDLVWWSETNQDTYGVTLYVSRSNGNRESFHVSAMFGESLKAADITGDGINEIIAMADTGGNGGMGCHALTILSYRDGAMRELPIPFFKEGDDNEPNWFASGYRFGTQFEDGCKLRVKGDLFDEVIDFSVDSYEVQDRILLGQFDDFHKVKYTMSLEESGCDGIFRVDTVTYDRSPGYELQLYQYLWQQGHSDGVGFGITTVKWDERKEAFVPLNQSFMPTKAIQDENFQRADVDGDGKEDTIWIKERTETTSAALCVQTIENGFFDLFVENSRIAGIKDLNHDFAADVITVERRTEQFERIRIHSYKDGVHNSVHGTDQQWGSLSVQYQLKADGNGYVEINADEFITRIPITAEEAVPDEEILCFSQVTDCYLEEHPQLGTLLILEETIDLSDYGLESIRIKTTLQYDAQHFVLLSREKL